MDEGGVRARARAISAARGLAGALRDGKLDPRIDVTVSEGVVLGLLKQGVRKFSAFFGHGNTDIGEILRVYAEAGVTALPGSSATRWRWLMPPRSSRGNTARSPRW